MRHYEGSNYPQINDGYYMIHLGMETRKFSVISVVARWT